MCTKICSICKEELPATEEFFAIRKLKTKNSLQSNCRKCHKEYRKKHYEDNKEKYILKSKDYRNKMVSELTEFKKTLCCSKCGEDRWWVLDFHHLDPTEKDKEVSALVWTSSREKIQREIEKCIVLCSNCHRDLHYQEKLIAGNA
jgi:hypothetical protein